MEGDIRYGFAVARIRELQAMGRMSTLKGGLEERSRLCTVSGGLDGL